MANIVTFLIILILFWAKVRVMVFNTTINNISAILWRSALFVEKIGVSREKHRTAASH